MHTQARAYLETTPDQPVERRGDDQQNQRGRVGQAGEMRHRQGGRHHRRLDQERHPGHPPRIHILSRVPRGEPHSGRPCVDAGCAALVIPFVATIQLIHPIPSAGVAAGVKPGVTQTGCKRAPPQGIQHHANPGMLHEDGADQGKRQDKDKADRDEKQVGVARLQDSHRGGEGHETEAKQEDKVDQLDQGRPKRCGPEAGKEGVVASPHNAHHRQREKEDGVGPDPAEDHPLEHGLVRVRLQQRHVIVRDLEREDQDGGNDGNQRVGEDKESRHLARRIRVAHRLTSMPLLAGIADNGVAPSPETCGITETAPTDAANAGRCHDRGFALRSRRERHSVH